MLKLHIFIVGILFLTASSGSAAMFTASESLPCTDDKVAGCSSVGSDLLLVSRIVPEALDADSVFGLSTALKGSLAAVGAPWQSQDGFRTGRTYLFEQTAKGWQQVAVLRPKVSVDRAMFGSSIAITDTMIAIGAPGEKIGTNISAGAVYIFMRGAQGWQQKARITADKPNAGDFFGSALAWAGNELVVGGHLVDEKGIDSGAAYMFTPNANRDQWQQARKLLPKALKNGGLYGNAIAAREDMVVVGAYGFDGDSPGGGAAFVFSKDARGQWVETQMLQAEKRKAFSEFGWSIALDGNRLVIGAPYEDENDKRAGAAYVFAADAQGVWQREARLTYSDPKWEERFGASVAVQGDSILIGAPFGVAFMFENDGNSWQQTNKLVGHYPHSDNIFSRTVAISNGTILLGVPSQGRPQAQNGSAYIFSLAPVQAP